MKHAFFNLEDAREATKNINTQDNYNWRPCFFVYRRVADQVEVIATELLNNLEEKKPGSLYLGLVEDNAVRTYQVNFPITKDPNGKMPETNYQRDRAGAEVKADWFDWKWLSQSGTVRQNDAIGELAREVTGELKRL